MASTLTPTMTIATLGLIKDKGLDINASLLTTITSLRTTGISGAVNTLMPSANSNPTLSTALHSIPSFLSGLITTAPVGFNSSILVAEIQSQANAIMSKGVGGFVSMLGAASSFAEMNYNMHGSIAQSNASVFSDFGFTINNFKSLRTGGISNQFVPSQLPALAKGIKNFGTMFSIADFSQMANPGIICQNLINQGLGKYGDLYNKLIAAGFDLATLGNEDCDDKIVMQIMSGITGADLASIIAFTNFIPAPGTTLQTLADVTNVTKLLSTSGIAALGPNPSLNSLANKLDNIGGNFASTADLSDMLLSMAVTIYPDLDQLTTLLPNTLTAGVSNILGIGAGPFGNPNITDILGAVTGSFYTENLNLISALQYEVSTMSEVQALSSALTSGNPSTITIASSGITSSSNITLQNAITAGNEVFQKCVVQLTNEKRNMVLAGIDVTTAANSVQNTTALASQLHSFSDDPMELGIGNHLAMMATNDIYGQSISASLEEGRNLATLAKNNVKTYTTLNPIGFASTLA